MMKNVDKYDHSNNQSVISINKLCHSDYKSVLNNESSDGSFQSCASNEIFEFDNNLILSENSKNGNRSKRSRSIDNLQVKRSS